MRDFYLQRQAITPISSTLIRLTREQVEAAQQQIDRVHTVSRTIIPLSTLFAVLILFYIARLIHNSVTRSVLELTAVTTEFSEGILDVRVPEISHDEIGQLAAIFNSMAACLKDLIENLETKVAQRTADLALSEERFRHLVRELPNIAVQGYDGERRIVYWNKASETLFGYSSDEATGRKIDELIIPEVIREGFCATIAGWYEGGVPIAAAELVLTHKNGGEVPVYSAYVMRVDSNGQKTMYCVYVDLAELRMSHARERRSETFYRQLFDHSSSGVAVYEPVDDGRDFIIMDVNRAGEKIDHFSREDLVGRAVTEAFPDIGKTGLLDIFRQVLQTGEPMLQPAVFYRDGRVASWRHNRVYKLPSGEIVTVYDDVSQQKQAEEEKQAMDLRLQRAQKMEAIGLMAGGIAHDLNNTLSAIVGYPDLMLLQLSKGSNLRKPLVTIKEAGERAAAVVADLLTVARGVASTRQTANLNMLVQDHLKSPEFNDIKSKHSQVEFKYYLAADLLKNISCSPIHVKKCIMNLIAN